MRSLIHIAFLSLLLMMGCAQRIIIDSNMLVPPDHPEGGQYRKIAVMPLEGPQGEETADLVGKALSAVSARGTNVFTVTDFRKLKDISAEQYERVMHPPLDPDVYSKVARLLGVEAVYSGSVVTAWADNRYDRSRSTECADYDYFNDKCKDERKIVTRCKISEGKFELKLDLIDVKTSGILFSNVFPGESRTENCSKEDVTGDSTGLRIFDELLHRVTTGDSSAENKRNLDAARQRAIHSLIVDISPSFVPVQLELMGPGKDVKSREAREKMSDGIEAVRHKQIERACSLFAEAEKIQLDAASVLFNLGVCSEIEERYEAARIRYQKAEALTAKEDAVVNTALARIEKRITYRNELQRLGF